MSSAIQLQGLNKSFGLAEIIRGVDLSIDLETPPALMMPHNPPYYEALLEQAGMVVVKNLLAYQGGAPDAV